MTPDALIFFSSHHWWGNFGAVAKGQKSVNPISANEGLSAMPREGCFSALASAKCWKSQARGMVTKVAPATDPLTKKTYDLALTVQDRDFISSPTKGEVECAAPSSSSGPDPRIHSAMYPPAVVVEGSRCGSSARRPRMTKDEGSESNFWGVRTPIGPQYNQIQVSLKPLNTQHLKIRSIRNASNCSVGCSVCIVKKLLI